MIVLLFMILVVPVFLAEAWGVMMILGALHHEWLTAMPAPSYIASVLVTLLMNLFTGLSASMRYSK